MIEIPNFKTLEIKHIVLDYNGTIAKDGRLLSEVADLLPTLISTYSVHVLTADTFGSVKSELSAYNVTVHVLSSEDHTEEKAEYVKELGKKHVAAFGNGNNDASMLKRAELSVAVMGSEGLSVKALSAADIVVEDIEDGLELLLHEKRLIATLRK